MTDFSDWLLSVYQGQQSFRNLDQAFRSAWDAAAAAEREACAKLCEEVGGRDSDTHAYDAATAIRARSNP